MWLAFWAASAHCRVMFSFSSASIPKPFYSGLLSIHSPPSLCLWFGLPWLLGRNVPLALLNFRRFAWAHLSSLPWSLWMASRSSGVLTASLSLVSSANQLRVCSIPVSMSLTNMLKQCRSEYNSWEKPHHWCPLGHWAVGHSSLSATIQPNPYPPNGPSIKSMSLQFRDKDVMWDSVKWFAQVQIDDDSCSSFIHQRNTEITTRFFFSGYSHLAQSICFFHINREVPVAANLGSYSLWIKERGVYCRLMNNVNFSSSSLEVLVWTENDCCQRNALFNSTSSTREQN